MSGEDNTGARAQKPTGPLAGCRVLELGSTVAGPFCGRLLADFGAEVIKIELPEGDPVRTMGRRKNDVSLYAASIFRNKKLAAIDLRTERGQDLIRRIAKTCDIVVENFRPGGLEKWGLGYADISALAPSIIFVRISGYGQDGPHSARPGYGVVCEASSGLRELTGEPDRPPTRTAVSLTDCYAGLYGAFGAVLALRHRDRTGEGQIVDAALCEAAFSFMEPHIPAYAALGVVPTRSGPRLPNSVPNNLYPTKDGRTVLIAAPAQSNFRRLAEAMEQPGLASDARFATAEARASNQEEIDRIIAGWTATQDLKDVERKLVGASVAVAAINTIADIFADPQFKFRDMLVSLPHEELGEVTVGGVVPKLSASPGGLQWAGRSVGADTEAVLRDMAGLSNTEIAELARDQIIYAGHA